MRISHSLALAIVAFNSGIEAYRLEVRGKSRSLDARALQRRASITGISTLNDTSDIGYYTDLTLGGDTFSVLIDTGSSDLWVAGTVPNSQDTGATSGVTYAVGEVQGPVKTATLDFAGHTINNQAFLQVEPSDSNPTSSGLIGLGPSSGSNIFATLNTSVGNAVMDNIFLEDTSTPNFLTVLLSRSDDPDELFPGDITVGALLSGYEDVTNQPKIPVSLVTASEVGSQHWQVLLDPNGVTGYDGKPIPITTAVAGTANTQQATVVFDSGFSLPQVPKAVSDAFYQNVPGSEFSTNITGLENVWLVPCNQEINVTFTFSGKTIPIHPLDMSLEPSDLGITGGLTTGNGEDACIGAFQPVSFTEDGDTTFDMVLGMAFLRNVYLLINYGDFVAGTTLSATAAPYVQMLSTTNNTAQAHTDFVNVRLKGVSVAKPTTTTHHSSQYYITIAVIVVSVVVTLLSVCVSRWWRNRSQKPTTFLAGLTSYRPLNAPAPAPAVDMHIMQPQPPQPYNPNAEYTPYAQGPPYAQSPYNQGPGYAPGYNNQAPYPSPWDSRG